MTESVRFDRAAAHYDTTRAISDQAMARTIELLASELLGRGRALEVGVGTGLLALPLHEAGVSLAGLDLTPAMMARLIEKAGGTSPFPLIQADATRMPFADDAFAGAYLRWVLHLIPNWRDALVEAVRVIEPGGVLLVCLGAYDEPSTEIRRKFTELTGVGTDPIGLTWGEHEVLDVHMGSLGARLRLLPRSRRRTRRPWASSLTRSRRGGGPGRGTRPTRLAATPSARCVPGSRSASGRSTASSATELETVWRAYDLPSEG